MVDRSIVYLPVGEVSETRPFIDGGCACKFEDSLEFIGFRCTREERLEVDEFDEDTADTPNID